ncbi:MAG: hypothetical protein GY849_02280 [Deltaproteobacteria bacterium]|nr:hypothetical protein [Deltaproteobacteria bacterium]
MNDFFNEQLPTEEENQEILKQLDIQNKQTIKAIEEIIRKEYELHKDGAIDFIITSATKLFWTFFEIIK